MVDPSFTNALCLLFVTDPYLKEKNVARLTTRA